MYHYSAYGLFLACEQPIPGLVVSADGARAESDIVVHLGRLPDWVERWSVARGEPFYASSFLDPDGVASQRIWETPHEAFLLSFSEGVTFVVERGGQAIWGIWDKKLSLDHATNYLRGPLMSFVLGLRGLICLHASAVVIDGRAVVFTGPSGAGKSTSASAFARKGFAVLTDDIVAISASGLEFNVQPGYPRLSLWPATAVVGAWVEALPRVIPDEDKRYVTLEGDNGSYHPIPAALGAVYVLDPRPAGSCAPGVEELQGTEAAMRLLANNCGSMRLSPEHRAREFEVFGQITNRLPVRGARIPREPGSLDRIYDLILRDFRASREEG